MRHVDHTGCRFCWGSGRINTPGYPPCRGDLHVRARAGLSPNGEDCAGCGAEVTFETIAKVVEERDRDGRFSRWAGLCFDCAGDLDPGTGGEVG
jgi:hypothetical protein